MVSVDKTQRTYDDHAQDWALRLREGKNPAHRWLEKPALQAALGDLSGLSVLALGCGSGEECALYHAAGARTVSGLDCSPELIEKAKALYPQDTFVVGDMENLSALPDGAFDVVVSSLAFHYLPSWTLVLQECARMLKPGGRLVFTTHHPVKWGALTVRGQEADSISMAYTKFKNGESPTVLGDYLQSRPMKDTWFGSMEVEYFHRPLKAMMDDVLNSPFNLVMFDEPAPIPEAQHEDPNFWAIHSRIPLFCLFVLRLG